MGVWAVDLVGWRSCVSEAENWLLIVLVLSVKKVMIMQIMMMMMMMIIIIVVVIIIIIESPSELPNDVKNLRLQSFSGLENNLN